MSNFDMFNMGVVNATLRTFQTDGLVEVTPLRFEALTPDEFGLWLRADLKGQDMFFVLHQTDYVASVSQLARNIANWVGQEPEQFIPPIDEERVAVETFAAFKLAPPDVNGLTGVVTKTGDYYNALAIVPRPSVTNYWGNVRRIRPGDDVTQALQHIPDPPIRIKLVQQIVGLVVRQTADLAEHTRLENFAKSYDGKMPYILPPGAVLGVTYEPASGQTDIVYDVVKPA